MLMYLHKAPHREWIPAERHCREFTKRLSRSQKPCLIITKVEEVQHMKLR